MTLALVDGTAALAPQDETQELKQEASGLMEAARSIVVTDAESYQKAGSFFATIKSKIKEVEAERTKRVKPLNDTVKLINSDFKAITEQLEAVLKVVEKPMLDFQREEERKRREAEDAARKERERVEAEARARAEEERQRIEAARLEAEKAAQEAANASDPLDALLAQEAAESAAQAEAAAREAAAQAMRDAATARQAVTVDAPAKVTATGTSLRQNWKFRIVDADAIPREFLTPDEKRIGEIARTMKESASIPGVEFFAEMSIGGR
jgi:hypothetical protein